MTLSASTDFAGDVEIELDQIFGPVIGQLVVERAVAAGDAFELVVKIGQQVGQRRLEADECPWLDVAEVFLQAAFAGNQLDDRTDVVLRHDDFAFDPRLADFCDFGRVGQVGGDFGYPVRSPLLRANLVIGRRVGDDQLQVVLALQPLADDVHVQQPEEADAHAKAEHRRVFRRELQRRIAEADSFSMASFSS